MATHAGSHGEALDRLSYGGDDAVTGEHCRHDDAWKLLSCARPIS